MEDYNGQYTGQQIDEAVGKVGELSQKVDNKSDKMVSADLPDAVEGVVTLASGKVYGSEASPVDITGMTIDCSAVVAETLLYYSITASTTITYSKRVGDVPTDAGSYVLSALDGVIVIGKLDSNTSE